MHGPDAGTRPAPGAPTNLLESFLSTLAIRSRRCRSLPARLLDVPHPQCTGRQCTRANAHAGLVAHRLRVPGHAFPVWAHLLRAVHQAGQSVGGRPARCGHAKPPVTVLRVTHQRLCVAGALLCLLSFPDFFSSPGPKCPYCRARIESEAPNITLQQLVQVRPFYTADGSFEHMCCGHCC